VIFAANTLAGKRMRRATATDGIHFFAFIEASFIFLVFGEKKLGELMVKHTRPVQRKVGNGLNARHRLTAGIMKACGSPSGDKIEEMANGVKIFANFLSIFSPGRNWSW
jgi:hypothetical protein